MKCRWAALGLLIVQAALLTWSACVESPTLNEPGHLVAGISNWQTGRFDIYKVNPPLVQMLAAAPVVLEGVTNDWSRYTYSPGARPELAMGEDFVAVNGLRSFRLIALARFACIPFSLLGGYFCFRWGRELYSSAAGLLSLALWCFCPNILAHGPLVTSDAATTSLGLIACYANWHWLKRASWKRALIAGLMLGIAQLTKMTLLVLCPLWIGIWPIYRWADRSSMTAGKWGKELAMLAVQMLLMLYVINLGYGFEGTFTPLGHYRFVSSTLSAEGAEEESAVSENRFTGSWLGSWPVPLPKNYLLGIDLQKRDFENYSQPSYLRGEYRDKGWWYYYLYALAIKVPVGTWLLILLASTLRLWTNPTVGRRDEFVLLAPSIVVLMFVSSQTGFSQHMRYVLPAFPFVFIWIGRLSAAISQKHRIVTAIALGSLAWSIGSCLWIFPHTLSYFNFVAGGPTGGPRHLIHSNVDWGQDLFALKAWLDQHPEAKPLKLAYFGYFDPKYAGINYSAPDGIAAEEGTTGPAKIAPGWYAISVNFVRGFPYFTYRGDGTKINLRQNALAGFQELQPLAMAGYSIYIYHVSQ